jgi:hypothetical protein
MRCRPPCNSAAELGADATDEVFEGGVFVLGEGESVHVFEGVGDGVKEAADLGVGGELGLEVGEVVAGEGFENGVELLGLCLPVLNVEGAPDGFVDVGVGEDDGEDPLISGIFL